MKGAEFIRRVRKLGRQTGIPVGYDARRGKGSHGRLYYGDRTATIIDLNHEIRPRLLAELCRELGVDPKHLRAGRVTREKGNS